MILNIRKSDGVVVDSGQYYDERNFENREVPDDMARVIDPRKHYVLDATDDLIKERARAVPLQPTYKLLMDKEPYGVLHTHPNDQLVVVLAGSVVIVEGKDTVVVSAGSSYRIDKNVEHLVSGNQDHTLILTVQI